MIFAKDGHNLLGLSDLGETCKAAQIAENDRDLATVALKQPVSFACGDDKISYLLG